MDLDSWKTILKNNQNYKKEEFLKLLKENISIIAFMQYRNELLQKNIIKNLEIDKNNLERIFLEPLNINEFDYIKFCIKKNNWTVQALFKQVQETGCRVVQEVGCPNI